MEELRLCVEWLIWKGRNDAIFEGKTFWVDKTCDEIKAKLWSWFYVKNLVRLDYSFKDWLDNPKLIFFSL